MAIEILTRSCSTVRLPESSIETYDAFPYRIAPLQVDSEGLHEGEELPSM